MFQTLWYKAGRLIVNQYLHHVLQPDILREASLPPGPKIIVANHPCTSDPAFVTTLLSEQASILILETLFKVPLFGRSLHMAGHVPVRPENGQAALEEGARLLAKGRTLIIFPEGSISPLEGGLQKPHTGAVRLALRTGVPVIPVGISLDVNQIRLIETKVEGKGETGTWYFTGPYAMTVGKAITLAGDENNRQQVRDLSGEIMLQIDHLRMKSTQRIRLLEPRGNLAHRAARKANRWYMRSAQLRAVQTLLLFFMLFTRHF